MLLVTFVTFHRQGLVKRLWPSPSRFYRAALRWVFCPKNSSLQEDAQSAEKMVRGGSTINQSGSWTGSDPDERRLYK